MEGVESRVMSTLKKITLNNPDDAVIEAYDLLFKLLSNIITNPAENKFRTIKPTNQTLRTKLFNVKYVEELLQALGFTMVDGNYVYTSQNLSPLGIAVTDVMAAQTSIKENRMSPEEKAKKAAFEEYKRKQERDHAEAEKLLKQFEADRKETKDRLPATDSIANATHYGARNATFKDIGVDLCAQKGG
eukprot:TRINITY_DN2185_c0_g1_i1.p1 TRINITY_DN2185_c0_g1~~TRINITY_DN2185_c0_g1_i1.p1  ORF type:complete len:188 (+),score=48.67 TRINITY_DN2185_c0_g1_i1:344-907(+)